MNELGSNVAKFIKERGMTQSELGERLSVTSQAVSKWEKGLSEPDFETAKKMCRMFEVSMDELFGMQPQASPSSQAVQPAVQTIVNGYCEDCKKPVGPGEYELESGRGVQHIYCKGCAAKRRKTRAVQDANEHRSTMKKSFIWAGAVSAVWLVLMLISVFTMKWDGATIAGGAVLTVMLFTFTSQMFWEGAVEDCLSFFARSFRMPGVIFSLDIGGILFMITVKVLLAVLSGLLSVLCFVFGFVITLFFSLVSFPFALVRMLREGRELSVKEREASEEERVLNEEK